MKIAGILETVLYAKDLEAAEKFYATVLGLEKFAEQAGRHVFFRCGQSVFLIFNPDVTVEQTTAANGGVIPPHGTKGEGHTCFRVPEEEIPAWREKLHEAGVAIESEVTWFPGCTSIYFRDPAGNCLELAPPSLWNLT